MGPTDDTPFVFLSYASVDRDRAADLADALETAGVRVWLDRRVITGGSRWNAAIVQGIKGCAVLALAATAAAMSSRNVQREVQLAVEFDRPVLPLRLEPVQFPDELRYALAGVQWVDVLDRPTEAWAADLTRALTGLGVMAVELTPTPAQALRSPAIPTALTPPSSNLPVSLTSFVGRERELSDVRGLLAATRLLTLTGPGGTGKTRLALEAVSRLGNDVPGGVIFVDLAAISNPDLVLPAIAEALGVKDAPEQPLAERLTAYLREQRLLLVLDNFEQVLQAAPSVAAVIAGAAGVTALVTSREALRVSGEQEYPVPPLALPDLTSSPDLDNLIQSEAVRLFRARATAVRPDFALTIENAPTVAEICRRLDGLPLALELAAARIKLFPPQALLARLEHRLNLLTDGARDLPARQQTLRDTIAWSFDLLDENEQRLFRRLGVFVGGCTLEAAEAVCDAGGDLGVAVLDGIASLIDKSLMRQIGQSTDESRFGMYETIREFSRELLTASAESMAVRDAHLAYLRRAAEDGERTALRGGGRLAYIDRVAQEHENLRAALDWSLTDPERAAAGLALATSLYWYWQLRGHHREVRQWLARLLAAAPAAAPALRARALANAGMHAFFQSDLAAARSFGEAAVALSRTTDDRWVLAWALTGLSAVHALDDPAAARADADESVALFRAVDDPWHIANGLFWLGNAASRQRDWATVRAAHSEGIALMEGQGDRWTPAPAYGALGRLATYDGDDATATKLLDECIRRMREIDDQPGLALFLDTLGLVVRARGDHTRATLLFEEAVRFSQRIGRTQGIAVGLVRLASAAVAGEQHERAAWLCGALEALLESAPASLAGSDRAEYEQIVADLRTRREEQVIAAAWAAGAALTLEGIAAALSRRAGADALDGP